MLLWWVCSCLPLAALAAVEAEVQPVSDSDWSGLPWIERHTPAEHGGGPVSFAVLPAPGGELFVANAEGVLRYFGGRWELIELPGLNTARSLALAADGTLYVGAYHHFGRLRRDPGGRFVVEDLDEAFYPDRRGAPLGEIWELYVDAEGTWFGAREELLYLGHDGGMARIRPERPIAKVFQLGQEIWLREEGGVLSRVVAERLQVMAEQIPPTVQLWRRANDGLRLLTYDEGFADLEQGQLRPLRTGAQEALLESGPYSALMQDDGSVLVGCLDGALYWFEADLSLRHRWQVSRFPLLSMARDEEEGLWIATEGEILRLDLRPQWRHLPSTAGYGGSLTSGLQHRGQTLLATSVGLYLDQGGQLRRVALAGEEVRDLEPVKDGVLAASSRGVQHWDGQQSTDVVDDANVLWLTASRHDPQLVYAVEDSGLLLLEYAQDGWRESARAVDPAYRFNALTEDPRSLQLWAGQIDDDPFLIRLTEDGRRILSAERISAGIVRPAGTDSITFMHDGGLYAATRSGLHRWVGDRFQAAELDGLGTMLGPRLDELGITNCANGIVLASTSRELLRWQQGRWMPLPMPGNRAGRGVVGLECGADAVWIASWNGLSRYQPDSVEASSPMRAVVVEEVLLDPPGEVAGLLLPRAAESHVLAAEDSLSVRFAHPALSADWRVESRLWPVEDWQAHAASHGERKLTSLNPGRYRLQLRAGDGGGQYTPVTELALVVEPPWQRSGWFQLLALGAMLLFGVLLARWRVHALNQRNLQLEATVAERTQSLWQRTAELESANQRLAALADQDGLTGVPNRRRLDQDLQAGFDASLQGDRPYSLLMVDLDHFKQYNDEHGHQAGDERLRRTAQLLAQALRWPRALLGRYGGEEFVVLLPEADCDAALRVAGDLLEAARREPFDGVRQTVSIGLAERREHGATEAGSLLAMADRALYVAKAAGRDQVAIFHAGEAGAAEQTGVDK